MSAALQSVDEKKPPLAERTAELLRGFRLPTAAEELAPRLIQAGHADALALVLDVLEMESSDRAERRVERMRHAAHLPPGKTLSTLDTARFPRALMIKVEELRSGRFLDQATNILCFGLPGVGKSHVAAGIGHALVDKGHSVLFTPTYALVQELLAAKRDLELPRALRKLDAFELLILDDIGYVQQTQDEIEVLFTLMAERYERRSLLITSNLVFSAWDRIFKNPMTTQAAIDRLVHHSVILEFDVTSFRTDAKAQKAAPPQPPQKKKSK